MDTTYFSSVYQRAPEAVGFAPGRIEFIGNHTDYNGGLVMGASITLGVTVALARREDETLCIHSQSAPEAVEVPLGELEPLTGTLSWANYLLGILHELAKDGKKLTHGLDVAVTSTLPSGAGLSSSAALELAMLCAVIKLCGWEMDKAERVRLARRCENNFVGVPCGILDQGVSAFGQAGHLVRIDCKDETFSTVALPDNIRFWILNTQTKHSLVDSLYETRFEECMDAFLLLKKELPEASCLARIDPEDVLMHRASLDADLFARARHITEENDRVRGVENSLACSDIAEVGRMLTASHQSSRRLFQNSTEELDFLVDRLSVTDGVYGARLTGGGFGGAVLAMTTDELESSTLERLLERFEKRFGHQASLLEIEIGDGAHAT